MRNLLKLFLLIPILFLFTCQSDQADSNKDYNRPYSPWIFRSVLDETPRMVTLALHDNLWVAYNTQTSAIYKAWKGFINFDGAVYTTAHGPQPLSIGDAYFVNEHSKPWFFLVNGKEVKPEVQYKGHRYKNGQGELMYDLSWEGKTIRIYEKPEYTNDESGLTGLERIFTTSDVPENIQVGLMTNVSSIALQSQIQTDGTFSVTNEKSREKGKIKGIDIDGKLLLNSNSTTRFATQFVKNPLIENPTKLKEEELERPDGKRLIGRSDCKTCHNTYRKTIGPAYVDIAKKYQTTEDNIKLLSHKVKNGGYGVWGSQIMSAHPDLPDADIRLMVEYILELDKDDQPTAAAQSIAPEDGDYVYGLKDAKEDEMYPGLIAKQYKYNRNLQKIAELTTGAKLESAGVVPIINAFGEDMKGLENNFSIIFSGYLKIEKKGVYKFQLLSDDGSDLLINDTKIIDHDGLHGGNTKDGSIALEKGFHKIKVNYFQGAGGKSIILRWKPEGFDAFVPVPNLALYHKIKDRPSATKKTLPLVVTNKIPGDGYALKSVHPSYDLSQARPMDFTPKVGGMDFLSDGRMVISTWDGDGPVYILDGVSTGDPAKITVKKIAVGFAEPLGLKVVDDVIYVLQKQELTRLIDTDGDEIIDEYQTVSNEWRTSANFHEFAFGLAYKEGYFYAALATAINPGGASTQPQIPDRGKVIKISKENGSVEFIASGLRTPNGVGIGVDNELFITDNQGDWLPSCKLVHVQKGNWFGSRSVDFEGTANLTETKPVIWMPQDEIGNSPGTPKIINDGPYKGQMIYGEVTHGGIKRVFVEKINGAYQGCLFRFIQGTEAGVNRMAWGPDGALYIGGIGSTGNWRQDGKLWYGLQRLKYNEKSTFEMLAVRAKTNGLEIEFTEPLAPSDGWDPADYNVERFWYKPTAEYGGPKMDLQKMKLKSVSVSEDRKKVFLEMDGLKENHVFHIKLGKYFVSDLSHELWSTEAWYTMNNIPQNTQGTVRSSAGHLATLNSLADSEKAAGWKLLFDGKTMNGWRNFRKETVGKGWIIDNGTIHLNSVKKADGHWQAVDGGDIITDGEYENFELKLEWKIMNCGNSGIIYNVVESDKYDYVWQTGPEMQILDNSCHPDSRIKTHRAGDLYDLIACSYETVKPAGEWNQVIIRIKDGKTEYWLNGKKVVSFEMFTDKWTEMIANSKFKDMPGFGKAKKGHISLQDHGDKVWFRNIKIREL